MGHRTVADLRSFSVEIVAVVEPDAREPWC
jgi:hypothetical protein